MSRDLPKYMEMRTRRNGASYRVKLPDGSTVHLGRDRGDALRRYHVLMSTPLPVQGDAESIAQTIWDRHRKGAKQRGLDFSVTCSEIAALLIAQQFRCAITALPFRDDKPQGLRIKPWAPSLDRSDSRLGYFPGNVRIVCAFVNVAMNGFGEQFFELALKPLIAAGVTAELQRLGHIPK